MEADSIKEKSSESDIGGIFMSSTTRTTTWNELYPPSAGGPVPPVQEPTTQPSALSSASSFSDPPLPPGLVPPPFAIPNMHAMPSLEALQSFGIPFLMQPPTGAQSGSFYPPGLPSFMGNASDQQRFLMAFADVFRHNLRLMQLNTEFPPPSTSTQPSTTTPMHSADPRGRISRSRSPSMSSESSSSSTPSDTQNTLPATIRTPSDPSRIFESEAGSPLSFFVQIDMASRGTIVSRIKKHGGIIKHNQADADYSILQSKSKIYRPLMESCVAANRLAVSMTFVHACVEHGVLFDHTPFLLQSPPCRGRRKGQKPSTTRSQPSKSLAPASFYMKSSAAPSAILKPQSHPKSPSTSQFVVSAASRPQSLELSEAQEEEEDRVKKDEKEKSTKAKNASHKNKHKKEKEKEKPTKVTDTTTKRARSDQVTRHSDERSPSPPPVHTRVQRADGKYLYPPIEKEYVLRYVQVLFRRDHEMGITTVAQKMHDKMPHHTSNSWLTTITSNSIRPEIDTIRKRVGILYRKSLHSGAQASSQSRGKTHDDAEIQRASKRRKTEESNTDDSVSEAQVQDDVKVLAKFLMSRQSHVSDDEQDEAAFWALLISQACCKTATSWKEFYQKHHHQVLAKCESIAQGGGSPEQNTP